MRTLTLSITTALLLSLSPVYVFAGDAPADSTSVGSSIGSSVGNADTSVSDKIINYQRRSPAIATGGSLSVGAMSALKQQGFKTVVDLRTPKEGIEKEQFRAAANDIEYVNLPVARAFPDAAMREQFKQLVENPANHPMLIHCGSANRVGMVWAAYQLDQGVSFDAAAAEGRAIGMRPGKEKQLVEYYQSKLKAPKAPQAPTVIIGE